MQIGRFYFTFLLLVSSQSFAAAVASTPIVVIDPGHSYVKLGATSATGQNETMYNDNIVATFLMNLVPKDEIFKTIATRAPGENIKPEILKKERTDELRYRPLLANKLKANLFISIHHDSTQKTYLQPNSMGGYEVNQNYRMKFDSGYSIFVSKINPKYKESLRFARIVSRRLQQMGRKPSTHHKEIIENENMDVIDDRLGIYDRKLLVVRETQMPAVLIEVGLLPDKNDLEIVTSDEFKFNFARMLKASIEEHFTSQSSAL